MYSIYIQIIIEQEENNNSVSNQQLNDDTFNHSQILQSLSTAAAVQQQHQHNLQQHNNAANRNDNNNTNDSLLALTVALRSAGNISPLNQQNARHLTHHRNGNHFTATNSMLNDKMLSPNISDLDSLTISNTNRPHRPPDLKGELK